MNQLCIYYSHIQFKLDDNESVSLRLSDALSVATLSLILVTFLFQKQLVTNLATFPGLIGDFHCSGKRQSSAAIAIKFKL